MFEELLCSPPSGRESRSVNDRGAVAPHRPAGEHAVTPRRRVAAQDQFGHRAPERRTSDVIRSSSSRGPSTSAVLRRFAAVEVDLHEHPPPARSPISTASTSDDVGDPCDGGRRTSAAGRGTAAPPTSSAATSRRLSGSSNGSTPSAAPTAGSLVGLRRRPAAASRSQNTSCGPSVSR